MALDPSIYQTPPSQGFNTPFQTLAQIGALQRQQQDIRSAKALEDERQQKLKDDQKRQQEADTFNAIIGNPDITRATLLENIRTKAPEHYLGALKSFQDLDTAAETYKKVQAEATKAQADAVTAQKAVIGTVANGIAAHNYAPAAFEAGLKELEQQFPSFAPTAANYRQLALQGGPEWIKEHVDGLRSMADRSTEAKIPGEAADSAVKAQVAAGTVGGLTPEQQVQKEQGAKRLQLEGQRLSQEDVAPNLTPEAKALVAKQFAMTGQLPPMGMGKAGAKVRTDIINAAAEAYKNLDLPSQQAAYKANQASLTVAQKQSDAVKGFEETALKNLDQFLSTAQKVVDTGSPLINKPLRGLSSQLLGSPEMAAYNAARLTVIPEFAKILSNPNLSGQLSDSARKEVEGLINGDATLAQAVSVAKVLKQDTSNRRTALDDQIKAIQARIAAPPGGSAPAATDNAKDPLGIRR